MKIVRVPERLTEIIKALKLKGQGIGFVPTMGALHEGHLSLMRQARRENDIVVASIFVNPVQFGPKEDFARYPRPFKKDIALCRTAGADFVFHPGLGSMYPPGFKTFVNVEDLSSVLCGKFRPGHFRAVATVVNKLFNIVNPDTAYFGQKDAQQAIIIKRMVVDLNIPVKIKVMPTVRESDGLAMSSRNAYLNRTERLRARVLYQALMEAKDLARQGQKDASQIIRKMKQVIKKYKRARIQYVSIVDLEELKPVDKIKGRVLIALAVWFGKTRLIDNIIFGVN